MRFIFRASAVTTLLGMCMMIYGVSSFNLQVSVAGLIFVWMGAGIYGHFLEAYRLHGDAPGNHAS